MEACLHSFSTSALDGGQCENSTEKNVCTREGGSDRDMKKSVKREFYKFVVVGECYRIKSWRIGWVGYLACVSVIINPDRNLVENVLRRDQPSTASLVT